MATDQLTLTVTCPECDKPIPMPTSGCVTGRGAGEVRFDTSAVRAHIAAHGVRVQGSTPGPAEQIVSDPDTYPGIRDDAQRHGELLNWLRDNGIEPNDVPGDSTVSIAPTDNGHVINHTVFLRDDAGRHYKDSGTGDIAQERRATPLTVPLPDTWPQPVGPIQPDTQLLED